MRDDERAVRAAEVMWRNSLRQVIRPSYLARLFGKVIRRTLCGKCYADRLAPLATNPLSTWLGLKDSTRRESMMIVIPVCGLRPRRARL